MSTVITKEDIKQEIEKVPDEKLETLYKYVKDLTEINTISRSILCNSLCPSCH